MSDKKEHAADRNAGHVANQAVYGPVLSRRLGRSLGVGFSDAGVWDCSWSCAYCQCNALPRAEQPLNENDILSALRTAIEQQRQPDEPTLEAVTIAGNGEPSLHPHFADLLSKIRALVPKHVKLILLSNGDGFLPQLCQQADANLAALQHCDAWYLKWDPGTPHGAWRQLSDTEHQQRLIFWRDYGKNCKNNENNPLHLQSLVFRTTDNKNSGSDTPESWQAWSEDIRTLQPTAIDLLTVSRDSKRNLFAVPAQELQQRGQLLSKEFGIPVRVFS